MLELDNKSPFLSVGQLEMISVGSVGGLSAVVVMEVLLLMYTSVKYGRIGEAQ